MEVYIEIATKQSTHNFAGSPMTIMPERRQPPGFGPIEATCSGSLGIAPWCVWFGKENRVEIYVDEEGIDKFLTQDEGRWVEALRTRNDPHEMGFDLELNCPAWLLIKPSSNQTLNLAVNLLCCCCLPGSFGYILFLFAFLRHKHQH